MNIERVEFEFDKAKVIFVCDQVFVVIAGITHTAINPWEGRGLEKPGISSRRFKPRVKDAKDLADFAKSKTGIFK